MSRNSILGKGWPGLDMEHASRRQDVDAESDAQAEPSMQEAKTPRQRRSAQGADLSTAYWIRYRATGGERTRSRSSTRCGHAEMSLVSRWTALNGWSSSAATLESR